MLAESNEYLRLILNGIQIDFAVTKYGASFRAGLDDLKLVDKIHLLDKRQRQATEILSSSASGDNQIIRFYFRQVEQDAPNFKTLYSNILKNILFECSNIHVACHRTAIVYLLEYFTGITDNLKIANKQSIPVEIEGGGGEGGILVEDTSTNTNKTRPSISIGQTPIVLPSTASHSSTLKKPPTSLSGNICELNLIARMRQLTWNMFDTNLTFGQMAVKDLSVTYNLSGIKTRLNCQLRKILIDYSGHEVCECYKKIVSCTGDGTGKQFFDLSLTLYDTSYVKSQKGDEQLNDQLKVTVGRIKVSHFLVLAI